MDKYLESVICLLWYHHTKTHPYNLHLTLCPSLSFLSFLFNANAPAPLRTAVDAAAKLPAPRCLDRCRTRFVDGANCWSDRSCATFFIGEKLVLVDDVSRVRTTSEAAFAGSTADPSLDDDELLDKEDGLRILLLVAILEA